MSRSSWYSYDCPVCKVDTDKITSMPRGGLVVSHKIYSIGPITHCLDGHKLVDQLELF